MGHRIRWLSGWAMSVDRQKIEDRIVIAVKRAKRTDATLAVNVETTNILAKHPDSPFSKEEIEAKLVRMALNENVPLQIG
jgi:hypothetical protein